MQRSPLRHLNLLAVWACLKGQKVNQAAIHIRQKVLPCPPLKYLQGLLPSDEH